jgi:hypothetical protein
MKDELHKYEEKCKAYAKSGAEPVEPLVFNLDNTQDPQVSYGLVEASSV